MNQIPLTFRPAKREDVPAIIRMLVEDPISAKREHYAEPLPPAYYRAFEDISADKNNELIVAESGGGIVGVLQLTFIPYLLFQGGWRALVEGVHVAGEFRNHGVGGALMKWAIARAEARGCHVAQITTDKRRADARRFYERLGFQATHEGMKLYLRRIEKS